MFFKSYERQYELDVINLINWLKLTFSHENLYANFNVENLFIFSKNIDKV